MLRLNKRKNQKSEKGIALLITLFAMTLMTFIAMEVGYDTQVDYVVAKHQVDRVRAYYAAKSGVELSLLRISIYKQIIKSLGSNSPIPKEMLEPIWSLPFMWPPSAGDQKMTEVDKSMLKDVVGESLMSSQYMATISPEGGRLDINDLGSVSKGLKKAMIIQLVKIFQSEVEHNEEFAKKYSGKNFDEIVHNIADYIDEDKESLNGGDESAPYRDFKENGLEMPPNRSLRTIDELYQVAGINEDFYRLLAPKITIYGTKGINVNYANKETLLALDKTMTAEVVDKALARRADPKLGGPFKSEDDFYGFLTPFSVDVKAIRDSKIPLLFDQEFNFRIISTGVAGNVKREITAITYDFPNLAGRYAEIIQKEKDLAKGGGSPNPNPNPTPPAPGSPPPKDNANQIKAPKGRPTVVSWEEN